MQIAAAITTAAKEAFGIYEKEWVNTANDVFTPDVWFMAVLVNDPLGGIPLMKEQIRLASPRVISSWDTSTSFPFAKIESKL